MFSDLARCPQVIAGTRRQVIEQQFRLWVNDGLECGLGLRAVEDAFDWNPQHGFPREGGSFLLREVDRNIMGRVAGCFSHGRMPLRVKDQLPEMLAQTHLQAGAGLPGPERPRAVALRSAAGDAQWEPLAGKSTLNRLELARRTARYHKISYSAEAIDPLLVDIYLKSNAAAPERVVLDLDATDIPIHGHQPERSFHGYHDRYCYLPL
jgi:hypothetical protein